MWRKKSLGILFGLGMLLASLSTCIFRLTPRVSEGIAERQLSEPMQDDRLSAAANPPTESDQFDDHPQTTTKPLHDDGAQERLLNTNAHGIDAGQNTDTRIDSASTETAKRIDRVVTPEAAARLVRDCPGTGRKGCRALAEFAAGIVAAPDEIDDGWSEWMEEQILNDLKSVASANRLIEIGVKCSTGGCAFYVAAVSGNSPPGGDTGRWLDSFENWLNQRHWKVELADRDGVEQLRSFARHRIVESTSRPYTVWYVAQRRP